MVALASIQDARKNIANAFRRENLVMRIANALIVKMIFKVIRKGLAAILSSLTSHKNVLMNNLKHFEK